MIKFLKSLTGIEWAIIIMILSIMWLIFMRAEKRLECMTYGFSDYKGFGYCVKRVNNSDSVVTLENLRRTKK